MGFSGRDMPRLRRVPVLTLAVVAVTAVTSAVAVASPTVLAHLERTPAGLHGCWPGLRWRRYWAGLHANRCGRARHPCQRQILPSAKRAPDEGG